MNAVTCAWQAAMSALQEAHDLVGHGGDIEAVRDLLRHAREMIDIVEEELAVAQVKGIDPDVVRMAANELRTRVDSVSAALARLRSS